MRCLVPRLAIIVILLWAAASLWPQASAAPRVSGLDVHIHVTARPDTHPRVLADAIIADLDRTGGARAILLPQPQCPTQREVVADWRFLQRVVRERPDRLFLGAGGDTLNWTLQKYARSSVPESVRADFERRAEELCRGGARVFGEMTAMHFSLNEGHPYEEASPDHPLFLLLADVAARRNIPIDLHMEAVPSRMPPPPRLSNERNPAMLEANVPALERLLAHDRRARIVWQHCGSDPLGTMTASLLRRLLTAHPNLYVGLRLGERSRGPGANHVQELDGSIVPEWLHLFQAFPDRFVVGSDSFFSPRGLNPRFPPGLRSSWAFLDALPSDLVARFGHENAEQIYVLKR